MYQVRKKLQHFQSDICTKWEQNHNASSEAYVPGENKTTIVQVWHMCHVGKNHNTSSAAYVPGDNNTTNHPVWHMCQVTTKPQTFTVAYVPG